MSAIEMKTFESQLEGLSFSEQIYVMEYLLKLMRLRQQNESAKSVLSEIQSMFAEDKGWASEDEMLKDLAGFRRERVAQCAF